LIDASITAPVCNPRYSFRAKWLTGLTYGIAGYFNGCPTDIYEIVVINGTTVTDPANGPMPGIYRDYSNYFTYTFPSVGDYSISQHFDLSSPYTSGGSNSCAIWGVNIPSTPTDCHASFFLEPDSLNPNSWTINDYSTGTALNYLWDFGDGTSSTLMDPTHTYSVTGNYNICLTVSNDSCTNTYCDSAFYDLNDSLNGIHNLRVVKIPVGIQESKEDLFAVDIFPNPADNELNIKLAEHAGDYILSMYDNLGREVSVPISSRDNNMTLDLTSLNRGIYMIMLKSERSIVTRKIIRR
jgi:hypothetical protein